MFLDRIRVVGCHRYYIHAFYPLVDSTFLRVVGDMFTFTGYSFVDSTFSQDIVLRYLYVNYWILIIIKCLVVEDDKYYRVSRDNQGLKHRSESLNI